MATIRTGFLILLLYLLLSGNWEVGNWMVGGMLALGLAALLRPRPGRVAWRRLPGALVALIRYLLLLFYDLIKSGVQVARIVLSPSLPIRPGIVAIPAGCDTELATALSAHAITVTPGELVVEMDEDGVMYTHCLDATDAAEYVAEAQRLRRDLLQRIFV